jgi:hypothetical protein
MNVRVALQCQVLLLLAIGLAACSVNPFRTAQTLEQKADAMYGSFVIAQKQAVALVRDPSVPDSVKRALAEADAAAKPLADDLYEAILEFSAIQREVASGATPQDRLLLASARLNDLITKLAPLIQNIRTHLR